ncbi:MAG: hypothetical protein D6760_05075, partial [Deltaproteobacteria bacterium]
MVRLLAGVLVAVALPAIIGSAGAAEPTETPAIVVYGGSGTDTFESDADIAGFTQIIDSRDAWRGYRSVGELLEHAVGIQIRRFGGREDFATISVRGSTPGQVKILLDGVPLNRAGNDVVNLADISLDSVERVEVFRGFTPVRYASSGAASVVNIVTRSSAGPISGSLSWGSFATVKATLAGTAAVGNGTLSVTSD